MYELLEKLYQGQALTRSEAHSLFERVIRGEMDPIVLSSLLTALKIKGETPEEISGAVSALLAAARPFPTPEYEFCDIVGTGGDGQGTINISTTSALVAASCGVKVAKHGNRSASSKSGSSDLLAELGIDLTASPEAARHSLDTFNFCFLFAPHYHQGFKHAAPVRQALKTRTLFNCLGPLLNPARPTFQLVGVYASELIDPIAKALLELGLKRGMVVHGAGLDEVAVHGPTEVAEIKEGQITRYQVTPEDFGLEQYPLEDLKGGTPAENSEITKALLRGEGTKAQQAAIAANVATLLLMSGKAQSLKQGASIALETLRSGQVIRHFDAMLEASR
ncbi:anthranilate phosphoribosyltransferase [Dongshaea marina]|uniref:anthranilate phosphoribosyltransferase n=1 Tax=Dongshaea marina TaxID=2047966 RepID=UPI000D3E26F8|nr:anthranilate phosphoribosyltransferase [Dongshaea marina]